MRLHSGHRLKLFLREHPRWDAAKLAQACDIAQPTVYAWQRDGITEKSLATVAETLGIDQEWLATGNGVQPEFVDVNSVRSTFLLSDMSKEEIAKALGVSRPTLLKYENENMIPSDKEHRFQAIRQHVEIMAEKNATDRRLRSALTSNNIKIIVTDDLMGPRLRKGDVAHVDTSDKLLSNSNVYAFDIDGAIIIRRVMVDIDGATLVSDDGTRSTSINDIVRERVLGRVFKFWGKLD